MTAARSDSYCSATSEPAAPSKPHADTKPGDMAQGDDTKTPTRPTETKRNDQRAAHKYSNQQREPAHRRSDDTTSKASGTRRDGRSGGTRGYNGAGNTRAASGNLHGNVTSRPQNRYLEELQWELCNLDLAARTPLGPLVVPHTRNLLIQEILRLQHQTYIGRQPSSTNPTTASPPSAKPPSLLNSLSSSPETLSGGSQRISSTGSGSNWLDGLGAEGEHFVIHHDNGKLTKCQKVYIPDHPTYNFVGRILGPRGISVRRLEADTDCTILIRGRGSIKDQDREDKLRDSPGYEHLKERLHVLVIAEDFDLAVCSEKLHRAVSAIERLLTPDFDGYKRQQLIQASYLSSYLKQAIIQLAIINGTYRQ